MPAKSWKFFGYTAYSLGADTTTIQPLVADAPFPKYLPLAPAKTPSHSLPGGKKPKPLTPRTTSITTQTTYPPVALTTLLESDWGSWPASCSHWCNSCSQESLQPSCLGSLEHVVCAVWRRGSHRPASWAAHPAVSGGGAAPGGHSTAHTVRKTTPSPGQYPPPGGTQHPAPGHNIINHCPHIKLSMVYCKTVASPV